MAKLPILSGKELVKILINKAGFDFLDQQGSHAILIKKMDGKKLKPVIPLHQVIKIGTLLSILRQAELTREDLERLLKK